MATVTGTFTATGVASTITLGPKDDKLTVAISGTYDQKLRLEREVVPYSGAWEVVPDIGPWTTEDATVAETYYSKVDNERLRLRCYEDTSGTSTYTLTDSADPVLETDADRLGNVSSSETPDTITFKKKVDVAEKTPTGAENTFLGENVDIVKALVSPSQKFVWFDDFIGTWAIGDAGPADRFASTIGTDTGANAPETATTVAASPTGRITIKSSDVETTGIAANGASLSALGLFAEAEEGELFLEVYAALDDVSEAYCFIGFTDVLPSSTLETPLAATGTATFNAVAADCAGIVLDKDETDDAAQWWIGGGSNTAEKPSTTIYRENTVTAADNTFFRAQVRLATDGTLEGWVNGTRIGRVASATRATINLTPVIVLGTRSDNQVVMTLDYWLMTQDRPSVAS